MTTRAVKHRRAMKGLLAHVRLHPAQAGGRDVVKTAAHWKMLTGFVFEHKVCAWCGKLIEEERARRWHTVCYQYYACALGGTTYPNSSRSLIPLRRDSVCAVCGEDGYVTYHTQRGEERRRREMELDHAVSVAVARERGLHTHIRAVMPSNLQWLCHRCHAAKTGADRRELNGLRRGQPALLVV